MEKKYKDCNPSITNQTELMAKDGTFMTDIIKEKCECQSKANCIRIIELLKAKKIDEATAYFTQYMK